MVSFSPSDAAFEGFRLTREKPKALLIWAAVSFLASLITLPLLISSGLGAAMTMADGEEAAQTIAALEKGGPAYLLVILLGLILQSVFVTGVYRAVLRPEDKGFGYLKLGMDEVRQVVLFLVLILIFMLTVFIIVLVGGVAWALANGLLNAVGPGGQALSGLAAVAITIWVLGLVVFVVVRLSPALPLTFMERRLRIRAAWRLTHGHFWRLLGTYVLAVVMGMVVWLLAFIVFSGLAAAVGAAIGMDLATTMAMFKADPTSVATYFTVPMLIYALFGALLSAVYTAVTVAPSAVAFRALAAGALEDAPGSEANMI